MLERLCMHAPLARRASNIFTGTLGPNAWPFTLVGRGGGWEQKADSTLRYSQAVPDPSTNRALSRLTSEVKRDPVHSTRYGRQRQVEGEQGQTCKHTAHASPRVSGRRPRPLRTKK